MCTSSSRHAGVRLDLQHCLLGGRGASLNLSLLRCGRRKGSMTACNLDTLKTLTKQCKPFVNRPKTLAKYCKPLQPQHMIIDCSCWTAIYEVLLWAPISLHTVYNDSCVEMNTWLWSGSRRGIRKLGRPLMR